MALAHPFVDLLLSLFFALAPDPGERATITTWEAVMAERMDGLPNPYQDAGAGRTGSLREPDAARIAPLAEASGERRWFDMEDSGDMMGFKLSDFLRAGLQVEFAGHAEDPKPSRRMIDSKWDPYHPAYLLTTAGLQIRF